MKLVVLALAMTFSVSASAADKKVVCTQSKGLETCTLFDGGESGEEKRVVTYAIRPASGSAPVRCLVAHGEASYKACPTEVGTALQNLNQSLFGGLKPADDTEQVMKAGGGN